MQIHTVYASSAHPHDQQLIADYIALREQHFKGSTYTNERERYDSWPDTIFVIGTDDQGKVLAGGRFIFSPANDARTLHFERDPAILSFNHLFPNHSPFHTSYAEFGAVVADPHGREQMAGMMLEAGALQRFSERSLPEFQRADVIIGSVVPKNQKIVLRVLRGTNLTIDIMPDRIMRGSEARMVMTCILNEELRSSSIKNGVG